MTKHLGPTTPSAPARRPSVTVVVPSHNYARYLPECAASVLSQRGVEVALIVVDDGSSDDTPRVTAALAASDERVTVIRHDVNHGQIPSVNEAVERVRGEYVVKLDADDFLAPGALARATDLLEAQPRVSFVYGRPQHFSGPAPTPPDAPARSWTIWAGPEWFAGRCRSGANPISQPEVVMRTDALRAVGPVAVDLPHTFDLHLWLQLACIGDVGRINGPAQGCYRVHDASLQRTVHAGVLFDLRARREAFDAVFAGVAASLPGAGELHATVRRRLAADALDRACRAYDRGRTGDVPVDDFVAFALDVWADARRLPGWRALERRRSVGSRWAHRHPRFFAAAVARRAREERAHRRWLRTGELA
jgi:glycosyltransferase involved in cell wall biosynthesis